MHISTVIVESQSHYRPRFVSFKKEKPYSIVKDRRSQGTKGATFSLNQNTPATNLTQRKEAVLLCLGSQENFCWHWSPNRRGGKGHFESPDDVSQVID